MASTPEMVDSVNNKVGHAPLPQFSHTCKVPADNIQYKGLCIYLPTEKILKRKTKFNHESTKEFGFLSKSRKDDFHDFCTECCWDVETNSKKKNVVY